MRFKSCFVVLLVQVLVQFHHDFGLGLVVSAQDSICPKIGSSSMCNGGFCPVDKPIVIDRLPILEGPRDLDFSQLGPTSTETDSLPSVFDRVVFGYVLREIVNMPAEESPDIYDLRSSELEPIAGKLPLTDPLGMQGEMVMRKSPFRRFQNSGVPESDLRSVRSKERSYFRARSGEGFPRRFVFKRQDR